MKKILLHIGPHKTGSTYIQKRLYENRTALLKNNIYYPEIDIGKQWGHIKLAQDIIKRDRVAIENFLSDIDRYNNIIISSEVFWNFNSEDISFFKSFLSDYCVEILFFKRNFIKTLISKWQESIKHGNVESWSESLLSHFLRPYESRILNCTKFLKNWDRIVKPCKLHILNYDAILENNGDIFYETLMSFKIKDIVCDTAKSDLINKSMQFPSVELVRNLNVALKKKNIHVTNNVLLLFIKIRRLSCDIKYIEEFIKNSSVHLNLNATWVCEKFEKLFFECYPEVIKVKDSHINDMPYTLPNNSFIYDEICYKKFINLVNKFNKKLISGI